MTSLQDLAKLVDEATVTLSNVTLRTPLLPNVRLSAASGAKVWLKREDLQPVRSYKLRGAYNFLSQLTPDEREKGVICASAGNHGQGVAWSCARLGISGQVIVPSTTPRQKRERIKALGQGLVELVIAGDTYDAAADAAVYAAEQTGRIYVPAFDHLRTAAGQGTVAPEIIDQLGGAPDVLIVPIGGGGMMAGVCAWMRVHHPSTRIIGVEPAGAPCMIKAIEAGEPVRLKSIDTFVDGAAVRRAGDLTFPIVQQAGPEIVVVPEGQVCSEMLEMYQIDGIIAEPAGALASCVLPHHPTDISLDIAPGSTVVAIVSGGNNDVSRYAEIVERSLVHEGRKHYFLVNFPQEPGALRRFLDGILGPNDDIVLFEYVKRSNRELGPALVGIEIGDPADLPCLLERMETGGIAIERIEADSPFYRFLV